MVTNKDVIIIFNKYLELIRISPLLDAISSEDIQTFLSNDKFRVIEYKKDNIIHFDGEVCDKLEIILSGKTIIDRIDESGNLLNITDFSDGDILGINLMFSTDPYYLMTVTADIDTLILEIPKDLLFTLLSSNKDFLKTYLEFAADNTSLLANKIKYFVKKTIRESIITYLKHEYVKQKSYNIKLSIPKKLLAEKIGVKRTSLSRELKKMKDEGLITYNSKYINILDKNLL